MFCLNEKLAVALHIEDNILNKLTEIIDKCRHINKHNFAIYDTKDQYQICNKVYIIVLSDTIVCPEVPFVSCGNQYIDLFRGRKPLYTCCRF